MIDLSLNVQLAGTTLRLQTNHAAYCKFLQYYFGRIKCQSDSKVADVNIDAQWSRSFLRSRQSSWHREDTAEWAHIGSNVLIQGGELIKYEKIRQRQFQFHFSLADNQLHATVKCHEQGLRRALQQHDNALFGSLSYHFVCYPLFWYLEHYRGVHVLHSAAVRIGNTTILLCGLDGVGKTMLTLGFLRYPDTQFISDNLILFDEEHMYSWLQTMRVRHEHDALVPINRLSKLSRDSHRSYYHVNDVLSSHALEQGVILFPSFTRLPILEALDSEQCLKSLENRNGLPSEMEAYEHHARLLNLLVSEHSLAPARHKALQNLVDRCAAYRLGSAPSEGADSIVERVRTQLGL